MYVLCLLALIVAIGAGYGLWAWMQWEPYRGTAQGIKVPGDPEMAPTGNLFHNGWMKFFGWKTVVVITVDQESAHVGYRFGYIPFRGTPKLHSSVHHGTSVRARVGHEDPIFILIREDGKEAKVRSVIRTTKDDPVYSAIPLM